MKFWPAVSKIEMGQIQVRKSRRRGGLCPPEPACLEEEADAQPSVFFVLCGDCNLIKRRLFYFLISYPCCRFLAARTVDAIKLHRLPRRPPFLFARGQKARSTASD